mgnify:CR=1 FL=1
MILLQGQNLARLFGASVLFDNIQITVQDHSRIALVGRNGAGKSTLLKILAGIEATDAGSVSKSKDVTIGYLDQHSAVDSSNTIWQEMLTIFAPLIQLSKEAEQAAVALGDPDLLEDEEAYQKALERYDHLQHTLHEKNAYGYESEIRSVLHGFQFYEGDYDRPISQLSGGQKTRLALAKILLEKNDLLILDEPTNHLDIGYNGSLLIVSHDRYFLDKVATEVYEISRHKIQHYKGNYSYYLTEKAARLEQELKAYEKQQDEISKLEDYVARNLARASTTKMAQSRRKRLEKMERMDRPKGDERSARFSFDIAKESGNVVLTLENGAVGYADKILADPINLDIRKQQAIAIVGPNGIGKSTLLKSIISEIPLLKGRVQLGANVDLGYYDQELGNLSKNKSVLAEIWDLHPTLNEKDVRSILGSFLFSGADVEKTIPALSGGEKARLSLCKLALDQKNFLVLDEPTNHLDIDSKEVLENALIDYDGTLLFVSHDRYFINRIATNIVELSAEGSKLYLGDYDYYIEKKQQEAALAALQQAENATETNAAVEPLSKAKGDYVSSKEKLKLERKLARQVEALEDELATVEEAIAAIELQLTEPEVYGDREKVQQFNQQLLALQARQDELMQDWEDQTTALEELNE